MGHSGDTRPTDSEQRNPFAPPPAGTPDRPWQPRGPVGAVGSIGTQNGSAGPVDGSGSGPSADSGASGASGADGSAEAPQSPSAPEDDDAQPGRGRAQVPPPHPWSPGYQGQQPPTPRFPYPQYQGPRFDPTDPVQRRARYALLSGIWGFLFFILDVPYLTLLLGALALYWGVSSLRGKARPPQNPFTVPGQSGQSARPNPFAQPQPEAPATPSFPGPSPYASATFKPQAPAAVGGLIAGAVSLALVATFFGVQLYYKSFFDCRTNALTQASYDSCATSVSPKPPSWLVDRSN